MKKHRLVRVFPWIIILSLLTLITRFFLDTQIDHQSYQSRIERVRGLQLETTHLVQQTLLAESGGVMHFDNIMLSEQGIVKRLNEMGSNDPDINRAVKELLETASQIKSTLAVFRNSWLFFPNGAATLRSELLTEELQSIQGKLDNLACSVLQLQIINTGQQKQDKLSAQIDSLNKEASRLPQALHLSLTQLLKHAHVLIDYPPRLRALNAQLLSNQVAGAAQNLIKSYRRSYQLQMSEVDNAQNRVYFCLIALAFFVIYLWRVGVSNK